MTNDDNYWKDKDPPLNREQQIKFMVEASKRREEYFKKIIESITNGGRLMKGEIPENGDK